MRKNLRYIFVILCLWVSIASAVATDHVSVTCGDWVTIQATPLEGFRFTHWSDGDTSALRTIQVFEDVTFTAFFAIDCDEYANWPVVALYDWLIMLNVKYINDSLGYYFGPEKVTWYQVVGELDDLSNPDSWNDVPVVEGSYYLTLDQNLTGTGDYYALIDVSSTSSGHLCSGYMCSELVRYSSNSMDNGMTKGPHLMPSVAKTSETIRLVGLQVNELTNITIYDINGRMLSTMQSEGKHTVIIETYFIPGCYLVKVDSPSGHYSLKFILSR